jgi:hypothetical protein
MKTLNLGKLKREFLMLTAFHGHKFNTEISKLDIDENIKDNFRCLVNDFMKDLFVMAEFDPNLETDGEDLFSKMSAA